MSDSVTPWTAACQASLSFTVSWRLPKFMSIEAVMPSNCLLLCHPLLLLPSIFPSIRVFSNESAVCIRWPKYWSFSFSTALITIDNVTISVYPLIITGKSAVSVEFNIKHTSNNTEYYHREWMFCGHCTGLRFQWRLHWSAVMGKILENSSFLPARNIASFHIKNMKLYLWNLLT